MICGDVTVSSANFIHSSYYPLMILPKSVLIIVAKWWYSDWTVPPTRSLLTGSILSFKYLRIVRPVALLSMMQAAFLC